MDVFPDTQRQKSKSVRKFTYSAKLTITKFHDWFDFDSADSFLFLGGSVFDWKADRSSYLRHI